MIANEEGYMNNETEEQDQPICIITLPPVAAASIGHLQSTNLSARIMQPSQRLHHTYPLPPESASPLLPCFASCTQHSR